MFDNLVEQMKEFEGITEQLKGENQMKWVCRVQNIESGAKSVVCNYMIYI